MNAKSRSIATAVALLFISGVFVVHANNNIRAAQMRCFGINSCKGQSFCATAKNACVGQNTCKGQGWLQSPRQECSAKGGRVLAGKDD
jgi:hypothetical protein